MRLTFVIAVAIACPATSLGQVDRYDLGLRLRMLERAWDTATPDAKREGVSALNGIVPVFFAGQNAKAAAMLDRARAALRQRKSTPEHTWADSLVLRTKARLLDSGDGLSIRVATGYETKVPQPVPATLKFALIDTKGQVVVSGETVIDTLPATMTIRPPAMTWPTEDCTLNVEVRSGQNILSTMEQTVSFARDLTSRLSALGNGNEANLSAAVETKTLVSLSRTLTALAGRATPETDFPAARLLVEAERLAAAISTKQRFYDSAQSGQFWLEVPNGTGSTSVRIHVPTCAKDGKPIPIVVALHGAGGSENMFFDSYGHGAIVRECERRGWLLVATRAVGLGTAPPVVAIIDELAKRYPIDTSRVYLAGHSMGAAHAMMLVQQSPDRFAAAAALGGGALIRNREALARVPVFVGCGVEDFAIGSARSLGREVASGGKPPSRMKEYPDCEHIVVCQVAMTDVFAFFEACGPRGSSQ